MSPRADAEERLFMINTDYRIEDMDFLLDERCLSQRYAPLIPHKDRLIAFLLDAGCERKSDAEKISDEAYIQMGLSDLTLVRLFRAFLKMYDVSHQKMREIDRITSDPGERAVYRELYLLPGVRQVRADLYARSGLKSLEDFANAQEEEILEKTARTIEEEHLSCIVPLPKEVRTHIAVSRAFTGQGKTVIHLRKE